MAIFSSVIWFLVAVCLIAGLIWLVLFIIGKVSGEAIPAKVQMIIWLVFMLICLLLLVEKLWPLFGHHF